MARPQKQTVEYFPHVCDTDNSKTLSVLQNKYGNDGYAFWFRLLEFLGKRNGLYFDYSNPADLEFLCAKTHQKDTETILRMLADLDILGAIDHKLYQERVIWCQNFVDGVADAFARSVSGVPQRPPPKTVNVPETDQSVKKLGVSVDSNAKNDTEMPQSKLKESKVNKTKEEIQKKFLRFWEAYPKKRNRGQAEKAFEKVAPDEQLITAILTAIEQAKKSAQWLKDNGQYIPYPATWINAKGWEDEYQEMRLYEQNGRPSTGKHRTASIPGNQPAGAFDDLEA